MIHDTWILARRGLIHIRRHPEALVDATIQPILFVLLFAYVFGGAINVPGGGSYKEFLMGGIFAQVLVFTSFGVAIGLAYDRQNGAIERFRSLPIHRGAHIGGHALANFFRAMLPVLLMSITGLVIGWRIHGSIGEAVAAYGVMVAFVFAIVWVGILLGSAIKTPEAVQGVGFVTVFPLTFVAGTYVPVETMPDGLRQFGEWSPVTAVAQALRHLFGNPGGELPTHGPWSLQHPVVYALLWTAALILVCAPLAVRAYQRSIAT